MTRWGQVQNTETTNTIHRSNRSNSALSIAPMFNLTTNLLCHKTSQQAATVQQLPSTELCLRIVWLSDGPAPRRWSPVKVSMELWARHMGRHCVVDKIVTFWGREFPFFSGPGPASRTQAANWGNEGKKCLITFQQKLQRCPNLWICQTLSPVDICLVARRRRNILSTSCPQTE